MPDNKIEVMVCAACGAAWYPQVWENLHGCPACKHPTGKLEEKTPAELSH